AGNYIVLIAAATDALPDYNNGAGLGGSGTGPVNVGNATTITQAGATNTVILGGNFGGDDAGEDEDTGFDFTTRTLSVFAGEGGDAYVATTNVLVQVPPDSGVNVDAGGDGNVYDDFGNTFGVFIGNFNTGP